MCILSYTIKENLNGECDTGGTCKCYKPWGGNNCGELQFLPIDPPAETNGFPGRSKNETTWGGNSILFNGEWHLFVAEMTNNCTLAQWGSNSQCAHAVSPTPEGPYSKVDVAVGVWCHNVSVRGDHFTFHHGEPSTPQHLHTHTHTLTCIFAHIFGSLKSATSLVVAVTVKIYGPCGTLAVEAPLGEGRTAMPVTAQWGVLPSQLLCPHPHMGEVQRCTYPIAPTDPGRHSMAPYLAATIPRK